tara:strand:- start:3623 stop:5092 length:1470 start_codon:yes stop_codon:yes gene_type:complete
MPISNPISQSNRYEFNDSVLETHAWKSSRYEGRQLSASAINKYVNGDSSFGLTPVIRNLTRTFYISSDITSLSNTGLRVDRVSGNTIEDTENPIEDSTLQYIPDFSYIIINKSVTVNEDDSIKITDLSTFNSSPDGIDRRAGFDREFQTNIPNGSRIGIKNLDADIKDRSNPNYPIYFNEGRLQPILRVISFDTANATSSLGTATIKTRSNVEVFRNNKMKIIYNTNVVLDGTAQIYPNKSLLSSFVTGAFVESEGEAGSIIPEGYNMVGSHPSNAVAHIFRTLDTERKKPNGIKGFVTLLKQPFPGGDGVGPTLDASTAMEPIRTITVPNLSGSTALRTKDLAELSTAQFAGFNDNSGDNNVVDRFTEPGAFITMSSNHQFNQFYGNHTVDSNGISSVSEDLNPFSPLNFSGSYDLSILNTDKPSLLVPLKKETEFPEGLGRTPLIIMPETLHPYVKDNIVTFMAQAGFDIGDITQINTLDETNRTLP